MQFEKKDILLIVVSSVIASLANGLYDFVQEMLLENHWQIMNAKFIAWIISIASIGLVLIVYKSKTKNNSHPRNSDKD